MCPSPDQKAYYQANKVRILQKTRAYRIKNREWYKAYLADRYQERHKFLAWIKLGLGCQDCGYKDHACALEFDHVSGEKSHDVSTMKLNSLESLQDELTKCEVVCANCHRVRTTITNPKRRKPRADVPTPD